MVETTGTSQVIKVYAEIEQVGNKKVRIAHCVFINEHHSGLSDQHDYLDFRQMYLGMDNEWHTGKGFTLSIKDDSSQIDECIKALCEAKNDIFGEKDENNN
jgi:hypothetical protein